MNNYYYSDEFAKMFKKLKKKYPSLPNDIEQFKTEFESNPELGVDLGGGFRKIRLKIGSKNTGKSGGGRIITFEMLANLNDKDILLVYLYDKSDTESVANDFVESVVGNYLKENN